MPAGLRAASRILWTYNLPSSSTLYRRKSDSLLLHRAAPSLPWYRRKSDHRPRLVAPSPRYHRKVDRWSPPLRTPYQRTHTLHQAAPSGPLRSRQSRRTNGPVSPRIALPDGPPRLRAPTRVPPSPPNHQRRLTRRRGRLLSPRLARLPQVKRRPSRNRHRTPSFPRLLPRRPRHQRTPQMMTTSHLDPSPSCQTQGSHGSRRVMIWG